MTVVRALIASAGVLALLLFAGCGDDPSRPGPVFQVPQVKGVIEPPQIASFDHPSQVQVTAGGSIVVHLRDRIRVLDAAGNPLHEIPVERDDEDHYSQEYFRVAATRSHIVVLMNSSRRVRVLTPEGALVREFTFEAPEAVDFSFFFDVAATEDGSVFVLDSALRRIQRFTPGGVVDRVWGSRGVAPGQMEEPRALVTDRTGNLYVLDIDLWRVTKFSPDGEYIESWDMVRTVQFGRLLEGTMAVDDEGRPVIVDYSYLPGRVTTLKPGGGDEAAAWPLPEDAQIGGVAVNGAEILLTDYYGERILRYSESGDRVGSIGHRYGSGPGETDLIGAIASPSPDRVTIFDPRRYRMENYDTSGRFLGSTALSEGFNPSRVISDGHGNFWCRNTRSNGVVHLSAGGEILSEWGVAVDSDASFQDLALDAEGRLFLLIMSGADYHVEVRTQTGSLVRRITLPRDTAKRLPADMALDGSGRVWILDTPERLLRVSLISGHAETVRWPASVAGIKAVAIAFDADGFLHVADRSTPRILVFDDRMNLQGEFGRDAFEGIDPEHFGRPFAIAPDGHVLVTASERRAWIFGS